MAEIIFSFNTNIMFIIILKEEPFLNFSDPYRMNKKCQKRVYLECEEIRTEEYTMLL